MNLNDWMLKQVQHDGNKEGLSVQGDAKDVSASVQYDDFMDNYDG